MSHFNILVASNNVESTLAPYAEYKRVETRDDTEYLQEEFADSPNTTLGSEFRGYKILSDDNISEEDNCLKEKTDYAIVKNGEIIKAISFYNPNAKFDYYSEETFENSGIIIIDKYKKKSKEDDFVFTVKHIAITATLEKMRYEKKKAYRNFVKELGHTPNFKSWEAIKAEYGINSDNYESIPENVRNAYHTQEDVKVYYKLYMFGDPDEFLCTEEEYIDKATYPFVAFVTDNEWIAKAKIGWFGCAYDEVDSNIFNKSVEDALAKIDENTELHLLRCHI